MFFLDAETLQYPTPLFSSYSFRDALSKDLSNAEVCKAVRLQNSVDLFDRAVMVGQEAGKAVCKEKIYCPVWGEFSSLPQKPHRLELGFEGFVRLISLRAR